jgi:hypothetical protein
MTGMCVLLLLCHPEQPLHTIFVLIRPFFCEQLLQTFLLHTLHAPLWFAHAVDLHISHLVL